MAVYSGKGGTVSAGGAIAQVTSFSFNTTSNNSSWGSTSTNGYKDRVAGVKDGSGSIEGKWNGSAPVTPGAEVALTLTLDTGTISCQAFVDSLSVEVDINDGEAVSWSAEVSANGAVTVS